MNHRTFREAATPKPNKNNTGYQYDHGRPANLFTNYFDNCASIGGARAVTAVASLSSAIAADDNKPLIRIRTALAACT